MSKKNVVPPKKAAKKTAAKPATKKEAAKKAAPASKKPTKAEAKAAAKKLAEKFRTQPAAKPERDTKKGQALQMLSEGTTIPELMERFGWLRHTTRGFLCILAKQHPLDVQLVDGVRTYSLKSA
jgi:uncharacterized protein DUF3489